MNNSQMISEVRAEEGEMERIEMDKVEQNEMGDAIEKGGPWLTVEEALQAIGGLPFTQEDRGRATQWLEGNCHLVRHWTLPKILAAYASHVATEKDEEIERLREALIDCGRIARAFVADDVSADFLMTVPAEVRARITTLKAVAEAARVFRELYEMEDANANDVGGGLEDLFAALDGEKTDG